VSDRVRLACAAVSWYENVHINAGATPSHTELHATPTPAKHTWSPGGTAAFRSGMAALTVAGAQQLTNTAPRWGAAAAMLATASVMGSPLRRRALRLSSSVNDTHSGRPATAPTPLEGAPTCVPLITGVEHASRVGASGCQRPAGQVLPSISIAEHTAQAVVLEAWRAFPRERVPMYHATHWS
jgi:hypothetical protein